MQAVQIAPAQITFEGLPRPTQRGLAGSGLGLGGTTSVVLPNGGGDLLTAIVQWAPPYQPHCPDYADDDRHHPPLRSGGYSGRRAILPCNRSSVVVYHSADNGVTWCDDFDIILAHCSFFARFR